MWRQKGLSNKTRDDGERGVKNCVTSFMDDPYGLSKLISRQLESNWFYISNLQLLYKAFLLFYVIYKTVVWWTILAGATDDSSKLIKCWSIKGSPVVRKWRHVIVANFFAYPLPIITHFSIKANILPSQNTWPLPLKPGVIYGRPLDSCVMLIHHLK